MPEHEDMDGEIKTDPALIAERELLRAQGRRQVVEGDPRPPCLERGAEPGRPLGDGVPEMMLDDVREQTKAVSPFERFPEKADIPFENGSPRLLQTVTDLIEAGLVEAASE